MDTSFLSSNRFWVMVVVAILGVLKTEMILDPALANVLITFGLSFIGVRTLDRMGEKLSIK